MVLIKSFGLLYPKMYSKNRMNTEMYRFVVELEFPKGLTAYTGVALNRLKT